MNYKIACIPGDYIGPEVMNEGIKVLEAVAHRFGHSFNTVSLYAGGSAIDKYGICLPQDTLEECKNSDAVLLAAVGGPKWDDQPGNNRPEKALLGLRKELGLYANLRPATIFPQLKDASPLKSHLISEGLDILIVRELTGGIYFGARETFTYNSEDDDRNMFIRLKSEELNGKMAAYDIELYTEPEIERIARTAFDLAMKRNKRVTSVDKANVLDSSRLWRQVVTEVSKDYPEVQLDHMYVDNAAMQLVRNPSHFDVILTSNMFGDILSDEASQITGSIGMLPSASLADGNFGMYEPVHGSAPDIAGTGKANPIAMILSVAMMLKYTLNLKDEADAVENAVKKYLDSGHRTADISNGIDYDSTSVAGDLISKMI